MTTKFSPVKEVAAGAGIKVLQPNCAHTGGFDELEAQGADLCGHAYAQIFPGGFLNMAPFGCINFIRLFFRNTAEQLLYGTDSERILLPELRL